MHATFFDVGQSAYLANQDSGKIGQIEQECYKKETETEQEWDRYVTGMWQMEQEWDKNGTGMLQKRDRNGAKKQERTVVQQRCDMLENLDATACNSDATRWKILNATGMRQYQTVQGTVHIKKIPRETTSKELAGGRQMRSISFMPSDDKPPNGGEGALH